MHLVKFGSTIVLMIVLGMNTPAANATNEPLVCPSDPEINFDDPACTDKLALANNVSAIGGDLTANDNQSKAAEANSSVISIFWLFVAALVGFVGFSRRSGF